MNPLSLAASVTAAAAAVLLCKLLPERRSSTKLPRHLRSRVELASSEAGWLLCLPPAAAVEVLRQLDGRDRRALRLASRQACVQGDAYVRRLVITAAHAPAMAAGGLQGLYPNLKEAHLMLGSGGSDGGSTAQLRRALLGVVACCSQLEVLERILICQPAPPPLLAARRGRAQPRVLDEPTWRELVALLPPRLPLLSVASACFAALPPAAASSRAASAGRRGGAPFGAAAALRLLAQLNPGIAAELEGELRISELMQSCASTASPAVDSSSSPAAGSSSSAGPLRLLGTSGSFLSGANRGSQKQIQLLQPAMPTFTVNLHHLTHLLLNIDVTLPRDGVTSLAAVCEQLQLLRGLTSFGVTLTAPQHRSLTDPGATAAALSLLRGLAPLRQLHTVHADLCTVDLRHVRLLQRLPALRALEAEGLAVSALPPAAAALPSVTRLALVTFLWPNAWPAPPNSGAVAPVPPVQPPPPQGPVPGLVATLFPRLQHLTYGQLPGRRHLRSPGLDQAQLLLLLRGAGASLQTLSVSANSLCGAEALAELPSLQRLRLDTPHTAGLLAALTAAGELPQLRTLELGPSCSLVGGSLAESQAGGGGGGGGGDTSGRKAAAALAGLLKGSGPLARLPCLSIKVEERALVEVLLANAPVGLQDLDLQGLRALGEGRVVDAVGRLPGLLRLTTRGCEGVGQDFMMRLPSTLGRPWLEALWSAAQHEWLG